DEAGANETVRQQVGDPHRVVDVGLTTGNVANVGRVGEHQLEVSLEDVPDRLPVNAGRLHGYVRAIVPVEPVREREQVPCRGAERLHFLRHLAVGHDAGACDHRVLVNVEASAASVQDFHRSTSFS